MRFTRYRCTLYTICTVCTMHFYTLFTIQYTLLHCPLYTLGAFTHYSPYTINTYYIIWLLYFHCVVLHLTISLCTPLTVQHSKIFTQQNRAAHKVWISPLFTFDRVAAARGRGGGQMFGFCPSSSLPTLQKCSKKPTSPKLGQCRKKIQSVSGLACNVPYFS